MHWAIINLFGALGWLGGLICMKGSMGERTIQMALSEQGHLAALGAVLCLSAASALLWANLRG